MTDTPPGPLTPLNQRPLTPKCPAAPEGLPGQRVLGTIFPDDGQDFAERIHECPVCLRQFSLVRFKHRCKACDRNVCNDCSKSRLRLNDMGLEIRDAKRGYIRKDRGNKSSRVCDPCARSYFESKLEVDTMPLPNNDIHDECGEIPCPLPIRSMQSGRRVPTSSLLRRRHITFFVIFSFLLFIRLILPRQRNPINTTSKVWLYLGCDAAIAAIYRMVRLDVFGVGILVLIAIDEWYYFQRIRNARHLSAHVTTEQDSVECTREVQEDIQEAPIKVDMAQEDNDHASLDKLSQILANSITEGSDLSILSYLTSSSETAKLLVCFGKATSFAGSTVSGYIDSIEAAMDSNTSLSPPGSLWRETMPSLRSIIEKEVELGTATSGGKKNPSVSRCVLRLIWFLDFVETILRALIESTNDDLSQGLAKAYETTLGTRHPWLIRKGVMTALSSCPTRTVILSQMISKRTDTIAHLQDIQQQMKLVVGVNCLKCIIFQMSKLMKLTPVTISSSVMEEDDRLTSIELPLNMNYIEQHIAKLPRVMHLAKDTKPLRMTYHEQEINLFKVNDHIRPSSTYTRWAADALMKDPRFEVLHLSEEEAIELVTQEWRTNMTRMTYQARLNPHEILDGPVVVRSKSGVVRVQLALEVNQVVDAIESKPVKTKRGKQFKKS